MTQATKDEFQTPESEATSRKRRLGRRRPEFGEAHDLMLSRVTPENGPSRLDVAAFNSSI